MKVPGEMPLSCISSAAMGLTAVFTPNKFNNSPKIVLLLLSLASTGHWGTWPKHFDKRFTISRMFWALDTSFMLLFFIIGKELAPRVSLAASWLAPVQFLMASCLPAGSKVIQLDNIFNLVYGVLAASAVLIDPYISGGGVHQNKFQRNEVVKLTGLLAVGAAPKLWGLARANQRALDIGTSLFHVLISFGCVWKLMHY
jgi:hypothetical protein